MASNDNILRGRSSLGYTDKEPYCQARAYFKLFPDGGSKFEIALMKEEIKALLENEYPKIEVSVQQVLELHAVTGAFLDAVKLRPFRPIQNGNGSEQLVSGDSV